MAGRAIKSAAFVASYLKDGGHLREQLLALDDASHSCTYSILSSPMPLSDYVAKIELVRITEDDTTLIIWTAAFECHRADADRLVEDIGENVFQAAFSSLKEQFL